MQRISFEKEMSSWRAEERKGDNVFLLQDLLEAQRRETRGWFGVVQTADVRALAVGDKEKHKQQTNFPVITSSTWQPSKLG